MPIFAVIFVFAFGSRLGGVSSRQVSDSEKVLALSRPVCLIPMGQTIDADDIPASMRRLDWMSKLDPSKPVSLVSIPATHDAGTALGRTGMTRCQVMTIPAQLAVGVRGFDVRLRLVGSNLGVYHGEELQHLQFADVLQAFADLLLNHKSEFLVVRIREEAKAINPSESFEQAFERYLKPFSRLVYKPKSRTDIPTVGQLRGKILLLDNYGKLPDAIDYPNPTMAVQDDYDTNDMDKKVREIVASFDQARARKDGSLWDVNYTSSCTLAVDQLANAKAVNEKVLAYLKTARGNLGLVLMNFPSVTAIHRIIASNFSTGTGASPAERTQTATPLRFGLVASINGDLKPWGEESAKGVQMAIDEFNARGGLNGRKIKLYVESSDSKPEQGKAAAQSLISTDKVICLLGDVASGIAAQMGVVATKFGIPQISIGCTRTSLNEDHPNMFRVSYTDAFQGPVMAKYAFDELKLRSIGIMTDKKQPYSVGLSDGFRDYFTKLGGTIVDEQFYGSGDTQFDNQLIDQKSKRPEGLFLSGYFNEVGPIARQAQEQGLNVKLLGGDGWESSEILKSSDGAIVGGFYCSHYVNDEARPEVKAFIAKWTKKYEMMPETVEGALAHDATMVACDALGRAKTFDAAGLRVAIENTVDFKGVTGMITLKGRHGDPAKRAIVVKITKDGARFVKAYEADPKTGDPKD